MIARIVVWSLGLVMLVVLATACAAPIYICQAVAPGTLACVDSNTFEDLQKQPAAPAAKPNA